MQSVGATSSRWWLAVFRLPRRAVMVPDGRQEGIILVTSGGEPRGAWCYNSSVFGGGT